MTFTMAAVLAHDEQVPPAARELLRAALGGPAQGKRGLLESAARVLFHEAGVGCADARELVDLEAPARGER